MPHASGYMCCHAWPEVNGFDHHQLLSCHSVGAQEADDIAYNKDTSKGPVFQPPKNDYAETFKLGAKDSKDRKQYDTGQHTAWATCVHPRHEHGYVGGLTVSVLSQLVNAVQQSAGLSPPITALTLACSVVDGLFLPAAAALLFMCVAADSAFFWADGANTSAITGHWLDIARQVRQGHHTHTSHASCSAVRHAL